jgi:hypothetical protein
VVARNAACWICKGRTLLTGQCVHDSHTGISWHAQHCGSNCAGRVDDEQLFNLNIETDGITIAGYSLLYDHSSVFALPQSA